MNPNENTILVVDDDDDIRSLIELCLQQKGYQVRTADNGSEALWQILQEKPELMIVDLMMPGMSGDHVCKVVKTDPSLSDIIVIILTAKSDLQTKLDCFAIGAEEYLVKPIDMEELAARVRRFLDFSRSLRRSASRFEAGPSARTMTVIPEETPKDSPTPISSSGTQGETKRGYGAYRIESLVGIGGMGLVYKAYDKQLDRYVALKVLSTHSTQSRQFVERFRREAKLIAAINHPGIANIYSFGEEGGESYFALLWCPGGSLSDQIRSRGKIELLPAIDIILQCANALSAALLKGVVHRDVKPSNIMFDEDQRIKIVDFGIAHSDKTSGDITVAEEILGSPAYMAPEQARGDKVDHRADIYALGITFYQTMCGELPFVAKTAMEWVVKNAVEPFPSYQSLMGRIPQGAYRIIEKMTRKNPEERYSKYSELISDLEQFRNELYRQAQLKIPVAVRIDAEPLMKGEDLFELLCRIYQSQETGVLLLSWGPLQKKFLIFRGEVILYESPQREEDVWNLLVQKKIMHREDAPLPEQQMEEELNRLLFLQTVSLEDFRAAYREAMKSALLKVFQWPYLDAEFFRSEIEHDAFCRISISRILLKAAREDLDFEIVRRKVPEDQLIARKEGFEAILRALDLTPVESFLASRLEGDVTLDALQLLTGFSAEQVTRFVYTLKGLDALEYRIPTQRRIRAREETPASIGAEKPTVETAEQSFDKAELAYSSKDYRSAQRFCNRAIQIHPKDGKYHYLLALTLVNLGKSVDVSEQSFRTAIHLSPRSTDYRLALIDFLKEGGRLPAAFKECESMLDMFPTNQAAARLLTELKRKVKA